MSTAEIASERQRRKERLAAAFRLFGRFGFDEGVAGHITARDPEHLDHFWVNPFAMNFKQIKVSDLLLVNDAGEVVEGDRPVNRAAFAIHSQVHAARPDVIAAAHAHSIYGKAFSSILDGHVTVFISGLILAQYGTGPVKGFAVTLIVGIICSLFTGVFCTRIVFDWWVRGAKVKRLSVGAEF